ncbi:transcription cofactor HES-6-like [Pseudochaenichthys georgianus]|uniref:transcription cofactor HES-6-like n=1 Tax=Pseudochaenichthys georgianus TaxID=52239 RepID=UPI0039C3F7D9
MTVKHLQNIQSSHDPTLDLEAQQKYSTGYIQCMHEVHNMALTCEWMDKSLGSRLLKHLLKSLPKSKEEGPPSPRNDAPLPGFLPPSEETWRCGDPGDPLDG